MNDIVCGALQDTVRRIESRNDYLLEQIKKLEKHIAEYKDEILDGRNSIVEIDKYLDNCKHCHPEFFITIGKKHMTFYEDKGIENAIS